MLGAPGTTVPAEHGVGLLPYIEAARGNGGVASVNYSYHQNVVDYGSGNWVPIWPLPEETDDLLAYTAELMATDGLYYGDNYWFTGYQTSIEDGNLASSVPSEFALSNIYPNPFNPSTTIEYTLKKSGVTSLNIYNVLGQHVLTIVNNEFQSAKTYKLSIDMSDFTSGIYFAVLQQENNRSVRKMMLLK